jgi:hypothetical protein
LSRTCSRSAELVDQAVALFLQVLVAGCQVPEDIEAGCSDLAICADVGLKAGDVRDEFSLGRCKGFERDIAMVGCQARRLNARCCCSRSGVLVGPHACRLGGSWTGVACSTT